MSCLVRVRLLRHLAVWAMLAGCLPMIAPPASSAADPLQESSVLKLVPADVGFFADSLKLREQFDLFVNSKAFAKLQSMPVVQMGVFMIQAQWQNPQNPQVAQAKQWLADDANQQLVAMLQDMVSHEVFCYANSDIGEFVTLAGEINAAVNAAQVEAAAEGQNDEMASLMVKKALEVLDKPETELKIPSFVMGFKLSDAKRAEGQLQRLEGLLTALGNQQPVIQQRFAKETIGGADFLTLRLDGSLVPWQMIPIGDQIDPAQMQKLIEKLTALKLVVSLGVRDDYLLLVIGDDNKELNKLGQAPLLYDREELASLRANPDRPYTGISYVNGQLMETIGSVNNQMEQLVAMAKQLLPMSPLSVKLQGELVVDIESFAEWVKANVPKQGAVFSSSFMTPAGYESFSYSWAENKQLDTSKPLPILQHVGADPIAFFAARGKSSPEDFDMISKFFSRAGYYGEQFLLEQADPDQQKAYETLKKDLMPLLERAVAVTRDKLMPALADGQGAIVLDAKATSKQWHVAIPEADQPLPMLELAFVQGVSDAGQLKEAFSEYFSIFQELLDTLHKASTGELQQYFPDEIPEIKLAKPQTHAAGNGTVYYYALPEESGLDVQIAPNAGLSDDTLVLSLLPKFTKRLLEPTPLQGSGPLANVDRPLGAAMYLNFAGLIEAIEPWIDFGVQMSMGANVANQPGAMGGIAQQIGDVLSVLKCFRGVSAVTYTEGNATVTHAEWKFEDLK